MNPIPPAKPLFTGSNPVAASNENQRVKQRNPSEGVKKLYFITVTFQTKLKVFRQGFADYEDGILVSLIRRRNEPFLTEFFEALRPFNAIFLAHHQN
jgi:hypothetical protein